MSLPQVTIVGGGISGLTCGWHLSEAGFGVRILEKEAVLGGLARSFFMDGNWIPLVYHHVMSPDKNTLDYIKRFNFLKDLRWIKSPQAFWYENRVYLLSQPQHIFRFKPLDLSSKFRLFKLGLYVWSKTDWEDLKDTHCDEWLNKVLGRHASELLFQNLMDIKFNMPLSSVSAAWLGRRMHQSIRNRDRYGYIRPGWQELLDSMARGIIERGGEILTNFEVKSICDGKILGIDKDGRENSFPRHIIVSTIPPPVLNRIFTREYACRGALDNIKYKALISFVCASPEKISPYYWSVVLKPHLIFGGFFNFSVLSCVTASAGENIYYFFTYLENDALLLGYTDEKLKEIYLNDIRKIFPSFHMNWFKAFRLVFSQPVFLRDYQNPQIEVADNFYLAGVYRQFPRPRTMDAAFYSGRETAEYIINKYGKN